MGENPTRQDKDAELKRFLTSAKGDRQNPQDWHPMAVLKTTLPCIGQPPKHISHRRHVDSRPAAKHVAGQEAK